MLMVPNDNCPHDRLARNMAHLLQNDFFAYQQRAFLELNPGSHFLYAHYIRAICYQLERIESGEIRRLLLLLPPRHLKSHCASVAFPTWYLGRDPSRKVIGASYNADLGQTFGGMSRRLIEAHWHRAVFPELALDPKKASAEEFRIRNFGGGRIATSVNGTLTGKGADLIIIDDPIKAEDAFSETMRDAVYHWITTTVMSRFNNPKTGAMIVVAQRLHIDDLPGRLIAAGGWEVLELPAIATGPAFIDMSDEVQWRREPGDLLHPERIDQATLDRIKRDLGESTFEAQYQQRPAAAEGNLIKTEWFETYDKALEKNQYEAVIQSWDPAVVPGNTNDYSVCTTWGLIHKKIDLLDVHRERHDFPDLLRAAKKLRRYWQPNLIVVETSHTGFALLQELQSRGFREVRSYSPSHSKAERMAAMTPFLERGEVRIPVVAPWLDAFLGECAPFPHGKYDDQVDTMSQLLFAVKRKLGEIAHITRYKD